jgi:hypothetical protein
MERLTEIERVERHAIDDRAEQGGEDQGKKDCRAD